MNIKYIKVGIKGKQKKMLSPKNIEPKSDEKKIYGW